MGTDDDARPRGLTEKQRRLAEEAWGYIVAIVHKAEQTYPDVDFSGAIAVRICKSITRYSEAKGANLRTWAERHAVFAIKDILRKRTPLGFRRRDKDRRPRVFSHDQMVEDNRRRRDSKRFDPYWLAVRDPPPPSDEDESGRRLLRGLGRCEFAAVWGHDAEGRTLKTIAGELGVSESHVSKSRADALARLREIGRTA